MEFRMDYESVIRQANRINNLSEDVSRDILRLQGILDSARINWKGPASSAFQNHLTILIADLKNTKYSMSSVSTTIQTVANRLKEEDERQAELALQLA